MPVVEAARQHLLGNGEEVFSVAARAAHDLDVAFDAEVVVIYPVRPAKPKGRPSQTLSEPRHSTGPRLEFGPEEIEFHSFGEDAAGDAKNGSHVPRPRETAGPQEGRIGSAHSVHAVPTHASSLVFDLWSSKRRTSQSIRVSKLTQMVSTFSRRVPVPDTRWWRWRGGVR